MQKAQKLTPAARSTLIQDQPADTLAACVDVLAFLMDVEDTRTEAGGGIAPMTASAKEGMQWVKTLLLDALSFEAARAAEPAGAMN